ncbi:type II toxin-antitoxin system prevent-host-death family antitoxin [Ramlibacter sp. XY19]|uniref:type II toxin-antitoxin system prevent-host-death family antitoxin n=1 Tax=Ramlibacter paludis TaxID=2908000 RepID=UPI0023DCBA51|nr:type II toxin-antitoxin system prevent-host-death family antitoxin [Ramlibacter paludis]MCG2592149.1 type II toxin-antitoxin system prevent-host-death family antitoxin [Ramlibacter paludis]
MFAEMPALEDLPRQTASDVKNKWREVVREVRAAGSVAITNHSSVEVVLVDAEAYRQLAAGAAALRERERSVLDQLSAQFDERLASLQAAKAGSKAAAVFKRKGKLASSRPKAGPAF